MARFKRLREDKPPEQCTIDQLIESKKTETPSEEKSDVKGRVEDQKLSEYASKRHFEETPEPKGAAEKKSATHLCYPRAPCTTSSL